MAVLAKAFFHTGRLTYLASTILHSCAISCMNLDEVRRGIQETWQDFNERVSDVDTGLEEWERWFASRWIRPGSDVLIVGCGSGREMFPFLQMGCRVTGIDPAQNALALARRLLDERGLDATLISGFIGEVDVPGRFDTVLFANKTYSLIPERARRIATLRVVVGQLKPGGVICLDHQLLTRPRPVVARIARIVSAVARSDWRLEPGDLVRWRQRNGKPYYSYTHAFTVEEIENEASAAGLRIVDRLDPPNDPVYVVQP